ncbi:MAG: Zn-dependent oligopeptidase [Deltaproteobacteria bacterium]|nr:Zn-dependent oligopeptidase [Deltaproteobacteria bacterium]
MPAPRPAAAPLVTGSPKQFTQTSDDALAAARAAVAKLRGHQAGTRPTEVLATYDDAMAQLSDAGSRASVVKNAHPDAAMREAAEKSEQQIEALVTDIALDRGVYDALVALDVGKEDAITQRWVKHTLRDFRRAGVDRDEPTRAKVKALNEELVRIGQEFARNIREDVRSVELSPNELEGLPEDYVAAHKPGVNGKVKITTDYPDLIPFMTYARSARAREALWRVNRQRAFPKNVEVLNALLAKRHELATLLGYPSWAAYVTEDKMIKTADKAREFVEKVAAGSKARSQRDYDKLLERKRRDEPGAPRVDPWDQGYLEDRIRAEQYAFDSQAVRPYFEYTRVQQGVLDTTAKMFGITYRRVTDSPVWHPDVEVFDVLEGDAVLGRIYLDMHPREDKYKHAAQFTLASGQRGKRLPEGVLMCNFPRPGGASPALMQHDDVQTFFHEFGHLLHHVLGGHTTWASQAGVRTEWDFVEAPSQMLEEWSWAPESLQPFAKHIDTGAPLPTEMIQRMKAAEEFGKGLWVRQQMFYAALSLRLYDRDPKGVDPVKVVEELQGAYTPFPYVKDTYFHLAFGHLDGYSAIYYTYMWSLVIAKDLFTVFKQKGLMNPEPAKRYRRAVLEPGGSNDAALLVKDFLGREYSFDAYETWLNAG